MSQLIPGDAVSAIQAGVAVAPIEVDGHVFLTRNVYLPPQEPLPATLTLHTLAGIVDFVNHFDKSKIEYIHVEGAVEVNVYGHLTGRHQARPCYAQASARRGAGKPFPFDKYLPQEDFVINVQTGFVASEQRAQVLALAGNLRDEAVKNSTDDGMTQQVAVRRGISMKEEASVPNPVHLAPYRTFPEIAQPTSAFIFRVQTGCQVALFQSADAQWEVAAIQAIADYLKSKLKDVVVIA